MFNITPWNEPKFPEIVQQIYNVIFVSVCQICLTRTNRPGKNSTWINDINHQHQNELSRVVDKMQVVPLGPKRVKLSECIDYKNSWKHVEHIVNNQHEGIQNWKDIQHKVNNQREGIQNWKHV